MVIPPIKESVTSSLSMVIVNLIFCSTSPTGYPARIVTDAPASSPVKLPVTTLMTPSVIETMV
ncbi:hypothetical protein ES705_43875 [subsurface metagenome]